MCSNPGGGTSQYKEALRLLDFPFLTLSLERDRDLFLSLERDLLSLPVLLDLLLFLERSLERDRLLLSLSRSLSRSEINVQITSQLTTKSNI